MYIAVVEDSHILITESQAQHLHASSALYTARLSKQYTPRQHFIGSLQRAFVFSVSPLTNGSIALTTWVPSVPCKGSPALQ
jgi:hypothetical protein